MTNNSHPQSGQSVTLDTHHATVRGETRFACGDAVRYVGPDAAKPVNRTLLAPYGAHADIMDFRRYDGFDRAEVMTTRGSRIVPVACLERV